MKSLVISIKILLFFTILTGLIYPVLITGFSQICFPIKSNGSLVIRNGMTEGSMLIGQQFDSLTYFSSRPSYISYNPLPSGGSNSGPTSRRLKDLAEERKNRFIAVNFLDTITEIPSEMIFASASGLDPHISPGAALLQTDRIVKYRIFNMEQREKLLKIIRNLTEEPQLHFLGDKRINVFLLNLSLDSIK